MIALAVGIVVGFALAYVAIPALVRRPAKSFPRVAGTDTPHRLDELVEAARAAALRIRVRPDGFDMLAQPPDPRGDVLSVRIYGDPSRVTLDALSLGDTGSMDMPFQLALALVPLYGPISLTGIDDAPYRIDGSQNYHQLRMERSKRMTAKVRELVARMK